MGEEDAVLIPQKSRRELFQRIFALGPAYQHPCMSAQKKEITRETLP
jgi:hypothetical protein